MTASQNHRPVEPPDGRRPSGLFIMDFDGTLLRSDRTFAEPDLDALKKLGDLDVVRTIATGRSPGIFQHGGDSRFAGRLYNIFNGRRCTEI